MNESKQLLDYAATYPNACIHVHDTYIILILDTNATNIIMTKAQIRIAGYYYLVNEPTAKTHPELNYSILITCKALNHVYCNGYLSMYKTADFFANFGYYRITLSNI